MLRRLSLLAPLPLALFAAVACGGDDSAPPATAAPTDDGGTDSTVVTPDSGPAPVPDAAVVSCRLDNGTDPVGLCVQKFVLLGEHRVFDATTGVPSGWDITGRPVSNGGTVAHDVRDDLGYAGMIAQYLASAQEYGDTEIAPALIADMPLLATLLTRELATLPSGYDGLPYLRLRRFAAAVRTANYLTEANQMDALADAWGLAIYTKSYVDLGPAKSGDAGGGGGGSDAGGDDAGDASIADAQSPVDAGKDAGDASAPAPLGDGILGDAQPGGGVAYDAAQAAMGALALIDLSARYAAGRVAPADGGAAQPQPAMALALARAAGAVLNHLDANARDDASGLYFAKLVTSPGAKDVVDPASPVGSAFVSDVQAAVSLANLRADGAITHYAIGQLAGGPYAERGAAIVHAMQSNATSLWDANPTAATTKACNVTNPPITPCGGGFYAQLSGGDLDTRKTVRTNAFLFAALHRSNLNGFNSEVADLTPLRALLTSNGGVNDTFLTVVFDQKGFFPLATASFAPDLDAGAAASSYSAAANADAVEGLSDQWVGVAGAPPVFF